MCQKVGNSGEGQGIPAKNLFGSIEAPALPPEFEKDFYQRLIPTGKEVNNWREKCKPDMVDLSLTEKKAGKEKVRRLSDKDERNKVKSYLIVDGTGYFEWESRFGKVK